MVIVGIVSSQEIKLMFIKRKLQFLFLIFLFSSLFFSTLSSSLYAQEIPVNKYGLRVIHTVEDYAQSVATDSLKKLVNIQKFVPRLQLDLRYNTPYNFTNKKLYQKATSTYLRLPAARALAKAQIYFLKKGYRLKIWDAYRPYAATVEMWELVKDDRYAADPAKGSGHNRGLAIDVTLVDMATGKEIEMGTGFDNFSDTAHHTFTQLPEKILKNRQLLRQVMEQQGFKALDTEWWHYYWPNDRQYDLLDLSFDQLKKIIK
jgi:D-alanyl-D-alanine dipeptidase